MNKIQRITELQPHQVFVFGSNEAGRHGAGAARDAVRYFGAKWGHGEGLQGQSYAIPTKDRQIQTLSLDKIHLYINKFLGFAEHHPEMEFIVTPIGCGLAGYSPEDIKPFFQIVSANVKLPDEFL